MQDRYFVPDVWGMIFGHLEPCFLADVAKVSSAFNRMSSRDTIYFKKLQQYFPNEWKAIPVPEDETRKAKFKFKTLYANKFATLKSSASRRLLSYIIEGDIENIRQFSVDGDKLYAMLKEEDADGNDMLFYINRSRNPALIAAVMELYVRSAQARLLSWNPFTIAENWVDKIVRYVSGLQLTKDECTHIYELSAAFNLPELADLENIRPPLYWAYDEALVQAVRFGHMETVEVLLGIYGRFDRGDGQHFSWSDDNPLAVAAKYNQPEMARRLLKIEEIATRDFCIRTSISESVKYYSPPVFAILLDAYFNAGHDEPDNLLKDMLKILLEESVSLNRVDSCEMVLNNMVYRSERNLDEPPSHLFLYQRDAWHVIRGVSLEGKNAGMVDLVLKKMIASESEEVMKKFMRDSIQFPISAGRLDIVNVYLKHGYVPNQYDISMAKGAHHPELIPLLREVMAECKPHIIMRKMSL